MNIRRSRYIAILVGGALCSTLAQAQTPAQKTVSHRDPFVNEVYISTSTAPRVGLKTPRTSPGRPVAGKPVASVAIADPAPAANVQGIIQSATGNRALVSTATRTYLLKAGDKLETYTVASVGAREVVLSYKGSSFKLPMKSEFTAMNTHSTKKK